MDPHPEPHVPTTDPMSERPPSSKSSDRSRRLAEALRANLRRRKGKQAQNSEQDPTETERGEEKG
jgi:hypothetical protein